MKIKLLSVMLVTGLTCGQTWAAETTILSSALVSSTQYYTEMAGLGLGSTVVMTGGGRNANIGDITGRSDDGFSGPISFNFSSAFSFFGTSYSSFYANNNGNITFAAGLASYAPDYNYPLGTNVPFLAPFFGDADSRFAGSGVMHLNQSVAEQTIVTWDSIGYYNNNNPATRFNSFQVVMRSSNYAVSAGEGTIGFFWKTMGWNTGSANGGIGGQVDPTNPLAAPAAVGLGDGLLWGSSNAFVMENSMTGAINTTVQNHHIWFTSNPRGGLSIVPPPPPPVPEPETYAMLLAGLGLLGFTARRRKQNV